jgi:hypothetical protein
MKKMLTICCALGLLAIPMGAAQVCAGTYGSDITIYDQASSPPTYPATEPLETEPGTQTGHLWDLTAFQYQNKTLSIIGGYDFKNGYGGQTVGDLFIKFDPYTDKSNPPLYGSGNVAIDHHSPQDNSPTWAYDYAIRFTFGTGSNGTYTIYTPVGFTDQNNVYHDAQVIMHGSAGGDPGAGDVSNPWKIGDYWEQFGTGTFTYLTGQTVNDDSIIPTAYPGGTFNVITGINLSFLGDTAFWSHLTFDCGNDNLMGYSLNPAGNVPIPGSILLLGSGLVGLGLTGFRRRKKVS